MFPVARRTVSSHTRIAFALVASVASLSVVPHVSHAWDADGHRMVTTLALQGLPSDGPAWLKDSKMIERISDQATVPDRWRSVKVQQLQHANNPDHYFDVEDLEPYGMTMRDMPHLRMEFIKQMMLVRCEKKWTSAPKPVNPARDFDKTQEWPGFLPFAALEQYGKLQSSFKVIRVLEAIDDPGRALQLEQAKADASVHLGILSHYIGDAAQPLHTTKHHHGWVGDNPQQYTTDRGIHSYIDGGVLRKHSIDAQMVRPYCKFDKTADQQNPWLDVISHVERSFAQVEPLYEMKKSGELDKDPGREFICKRLADGAETLSALVNAAWLAAAPAASDIETFKRYDGDRQ